MSGTTVVASVIAALALLGLFVVWWFVDVRGNRRHRRGRMRSALERAGTESEAHRRLLRHLTDSLSEAGIAVLTPTDDDVRLVVTLGDRVQGTPLSALPGQELPADGCLAARVGEPQAQEPGGARIPCSVCGELPGAARCQPIQVGESRFGAVLTAGEAPLTSVERRELTAAVSAAAPLIALRRTEARAERGSAVDALTGLPGGSLTEAELARLSARAGRSVSPLSAILVDVDHLTPLNLQHGRRAGDRVLAAVAQTLQDGVRASDFVARHHGASFLILTPDTDRRGGTELAEKLRSAVQLVLLPGIGPVTASLGVAALPEDAVEPEGLLRRADQALRAAKAAGRNRVAAAV